MFGINSAKKSTVSFSQKGRFNPTTGKRKLMEHLYQKSVHMITKKRSKRLGRQGTSGRIGSIVSLESYKQQVKVNYQLEKNCAACLVVIPVRWGRLIRR